MPTYTSICVNRGTPRTPRQHCVDDLGGTRREPTAHDGSREIRIYQQRAAKGPDLHRVHPELKKLLVLRLFVSLIYRPITNPANTKILARP
jgi:hypothetical protein